MTEPHPTSSDPAYAGEAVSTTGARKQRMRRIGLAAGAAVLAASTVAMAIGSQGGSDSDGAMSTSSAGSVQGAGADVESIEEAALVGADAGDAERSARGNENAAGNLAPLDDRAVVRTGSLELRADDVLLVRREVVNAIVALGGYVADERSEAAADGGLAVSDLTLTVPTNEFDTAMQRVGAAGTVTARTQSARDVTEQVVDVDTRVSSAQASLRRIRLLLGRAVTLGDVIRLEGVLSTRQADLESLLAQQQSLAAKTDLATLQVTIQQPAPAEADEPDEVAGFFAGLGRGWDALASGYVTLATAFGTALPTLLVLGLLALLARWVVRRFRRAGEPSGAAA